MEISIEPGVTELYGKLYHFVLFCVVEDVDYMAQSDDERVQNMQDVDKLAELLSAAR